MESDAEQLMSVCGIQDGVWKKWQDKFAKLHGAVWAAPSDGLCIMTLYVLSFFLWATSIHAAHHSLHHGCQRTLPARTSHAATR